MAIVKQSRRRVVVVDDSRTSQAVLEAAFDARPDFEVVGVAANAADGIDLVRRLGPDVVTIDLCMPYVDGAGMLDLMVAMTGVCKLIVSDAAVDNVRVSSKLESLGASFCASKREVANDPAGFFRKVNRACDRVAVAVRHEAYPDMLSSDPSRRSGVRIPGPPVHYGFPIPADEEDRLCALQAKRLANAMRERQFDLITRFASEATGFPVCLLTFIDRDTQWIKSCFGFEGDSLARADAFCNHTIAAGALFVVPNAESDPRFASNPFVVGEPGFRTYVGHPIVSEAGVRLGALCVLDTKVRSVTAPVTRRLASLSGIIGSMIDSRPAHAA